MQLREEELFKNSFYFLLESEAMSHDVLNKRIKQLSRDELEDIAQRAIQLMLRERKARHTIQKRINKKFYETLYTAF